MFNPPPMIRHVIALALSAAAITSHAAESDSNVSAMRYVSLDVSGDNANSRQYSATGSVAMGNYTWLKGTVGKLNDSNATTLGDLSNFGIGTGIKGKHLQFNVDFSQYKNSSSYKQGDVTASMDWSDSKFTVGLDALHRTTDNSLDTTRNFPTLGLTNVALHVNEKLTGNGFGAHADINLTEQLTLSLGGMSYHYDSDYTLTSSTNPVLIRRLLARFPTISQLVYLNSSGVTRALALLDNSYNLGLSYQFSSVALSTQYLRDKALDTGDITNTMTLSASIFLGDHWMLSPSIGQSRTDQASDVTFGGLSASYNW